MTHLEAMRRIREKLEATRAHAAPHVTRAAAGLRRAARAGWNLVATPPGEQATQRSMRKHLIAIGTADLLEAIRVFRRRACVCPETGALRASPDRPALVPAWDGFFGVALEDKADKRLVLGEAATLRGDVRYGAADL